MTTTTTIRHPAFFPRLQNHPFGRRTVFYVCIITVLLLLVSVGEAFSVVSSTHHHRRSGGAGYQSPLDQRRQQQPQRRIPTTTQLYFFPRKDNEETTATTTTTTEGEPNSSASPSSSPFMDWFRRGNNNNNNNSESSSPAGGNHGDEPEKSEKSEAVVTTVEKQSTVLTPEEQAQKLRAEAEKARLEAERMDAELTLRKIEKLERELAAAANKSSDKNKNTDQLQSELNALLLKVRGEQRKSETTSRSTTADTVSSSSTTSSSSSPPPEPLWPKFVDPYDSEEYETIVKAVEVLPEFIRTAMALQVEINVDDITNNNNNNNNNKVNVTELATRFYQMRRGDFSFSSKPPPQFTERQIQDMVRTVQIAKKEAAEVKASQENDGSTSTPFPLPKSKLFADKNLNIVDATSLDDLTDIGVQIFLEDQRFENVDERDFARLVLEYNYYTEVTEDQLEVKSEKIMKQLASEPWMKPFVSNGVIMTALDGSIDTLYPKCTTKKDKDGPKQPTEAQVQQLVSDILPKAGFKTTAKVESVLGGYIVRGTSSTANGDELIAKIDKAMERSSLQDKMTVLYSPDFTVFTDEEALEGFDLDDQPPILFITAPEICRESKPIQLSIVTGLGIATSWYLSLYPFLLNPDIAARVDEQLALVDAGMTPDMGWLTDYSFPLFATFIGIQLAHELGHIVVAGANGVSQSRFCVCLYRLVLRARDSEIKFS
jgi:hypothetical protein